MGRNKVAGSKRSMNVALQGGGAHGAFTWGVLDRLLEGDGIEIGWASGTSAGAVNAVALFDGLARAGSSDERATAARERLRDVWDGVADAAVPDLFSFNPFFYGLSNSSSFSQMAGYFSPYQINPLGFDPLRDLLAERIDFSAISEADDLGDMVIAATDVFTGAKRLFRRSELTLDVVRASACLPTIHQAVQIDGRAYWDGGFTSNPDLTTIAAESPVRDTLLIQLNPVEVGEVPTSAPGITARANTVSFNQPLLQEIEIIRLARAARKKWLTMGNVLKLETGPPDTRLRAIARHRFHVIRSGEHTAALGLNSKMKPDRGMLDDLFEAGRLEADIWLKAHRSDIGKRDTSGW